MRWLAPPNLGFLWLISAFALCWLLKPLRHYLRNRARGSMDGPGARYLERCQARLMARNNETHRIDAPAPRTLLRKTFGAEFTGLTLAQRVQVAAEASGRAGRRIGAVVLPLDRVENPSSGKDLSAISFMAGRLADHLQSKILRSDYAGVADDDRILIFVSLLRTRDDLAQIAERLRAECSAFLREEAGAHYAIGWPGMAMYPLDGYDGDELYSAARRRASPPLLAPCRAPA